MCSVCSVPSSPRPWSWPAGRRADDPGGGRDGQRSQVECRDVRLLLGEFSTSLLAQQSKIYDARGGLITTPYDENRIIVSLKSISKPMQDAQIAIEDSRFREHGGVDPRGITRSALVSNFQAATPRARPR